MARYFTQFGSEVEIRSAFHMAGDQNADQIPEGVKLLLDMPGVKYVAVVFDHVFNKLKD
jgi:hypothetical protein